MEGIPKHPERAMLSRANVRFAVKQVRGLSAHRGNKQLARAQYELNMLINN